MTRLFIIRVACIACDLHRKKKYNFKRIEMNRRQHHLHRGEGVSVYCFTGLSNERPKSNVLPFWGNILLASLWNKNNLIKFAFFDFTLKKKKKKTLELKK